MQVPEPAEQPKASTPPWFDRLARYALAAFSVGLALGLRLAIDPIWKDRLPFGFFFLAVIVLAQFVGAVPTLFAIVAGLLLGDWFFMSPRTACSIHEPLYRLNAALYLVVCLGVLPLSLWTRRVLARERAARAEKELLVDQSRKAMAEVKTLSGLFPICAYCKKIRDDKGYGTRSKATCATIPAPISPTASARTAPSIITPTSCTTNRTARERWTPGRRSALVIRDDKRRCSHWRSFWSGRQWARQLKAARPCFPWMANGCWPPTRTMPAATANGNRPPPRSQACQIPRGLSRTPSRSTTASRGIGRILKRQATFRRVGRMLLRFWQVDYKADVWLNGSAIGSHEGGESPFVFDVTGVVKPGLRNRLAVRVLNPTHQPIDGIVLNQTAHRNKVLSYGPGNSFDTGGIEDSVELLTVPIARVEDLFVRPDWKTGEIRVKLNVRNAGAGAFQRDPTCRRAGGHGRDAHPHQFRAQVARGGHAH